MPLPTYYTQEELEEIGFASLGIEVYISRFARIYNPEKISIGSYIRIDDFCIITANGGVSIGNFVHIAAFSMLLGGAGIELKDLTGLSARASIFTESDDFSGNSLAGPTVPVKFKNGLKRGKVTLEKFSVLGPNSIILPGVTLKSTIFITSHSLVTKSLEEKGVYFGVPVKRIKRVSDEKILELEKKLREEIKLP